MESGDRMLNSAVNDSDLCRLFERAQARGALTQKLFHLGQHFDCSIKHSIASALIRSNPNEVLRARICC